MYHKMQRVIGLAVYPLLFLFGVAYALFIALRPLSSKYTWLEVVIGDAITDAGMSALIWRYTGSKRLAGIPWLAHALTGCPMILAQILKHKVQESSAHALERIIEEG